ncbi:MAG: hypothetical protein AAFW65_04635 [Pseudomonadota bacterium]
MSRLWLILPVALICAPALAEDRPAPLAAALAAASDGPLYAYDMTFEGSGVTERGKVDPTQPEGQRITVDSPAREAWPDGFEEDLKELDADADGDIWCAGLAEHVPEAVTLIEETDRTATYTFVPEPGENADGTDRKVMKKLIGEITVDTINPAILAFSMKAPKPFKPALVAKIETFDMSVQCARAPDGRTYVEEMNMIVEGSALGQSFSERARQAITQLFPSGA